MGKTSWWSKVAWVLLGAYAVAWRRQPQVAQSIGVEGGIPLADDIDSEFNCTEILELGKDIFVSLCSQARSGVDEAIVKDENVLIGVEDFGIQPADAHELVASLPDSFSAESEFNSTQEQHLFDLNQIHPAS